MCLPSKEGIQITYGITKWARRALEPFLKIMHSEERGRGINNNIDTEIIINNN